MDIFRYFKGENHISTGDINIGLKEYEKKEVQRYLLQEPRQ